jgi:hypothetical protein
LNFFAELSVVGAIYGHVIDFQIHLDWGLSHGSFFTLLEHKHVVVCLKTIANMQITGSIPSEVGVLASLTVLSLGEFAFRFFPFQTLAPVFLHDSYTAVDQQKHIIQMGIH